jgi:D-glycero-alpha-D-manno-heptose-7-phosphate kinase
MSLSLPFSTTAPSSPDAGTVVRARAPLRLGLGGGGTDLSPYCDRFGGLVLNAAINRFVDATVETPRDRRVRFVDHTIGAHWEGTPEEAVSTPVDRLKLHAGVYRRFLRLIGTDEPFPVVVTTGSNTRPRAGLGASSTLVVAMVAAFAHACNASINAYDIARLAVEIERHDLRIPGGRQDQYAAAFGGMNLLHVSADDRVEVTPVAVHPSVLSRLEASLVLFHTGMERESRSIIDEQQRGLSVTGRSITMDAMHALKQCARRMHASLLAGELGAFHEAMNDSWTAKKQTAQHISNSAIEAIYSAAMTAGALSGKVSGAGGGGFMALFVEPEARGRVLSALRPFQGEVAECGFSPTGCHIVQSADPSV